MDYSQIIHLLTLQVWLNFILDIGTPIRLNAMEIILEEQKSQDLINVIILLTKEIYRIKNYCKKLLLIH